MDSVEERKVLVVGLGKTGLSCARHLHRLGLPFAIVDTREQPPELEALRREMPEVAVYTARIPGEMLAGASELIVSPGIAPDDPLLSEAVEAGATIIGDIDLFMREADALIKERLASL
mgnify:CR=1 FL=1